MVAPARSCRESGAPDAPTGTFTRVSHRSLEEASESVIDRLLEALAAQLAEGAPALSAGAAEALTGLSQEEAEVVFGSAGHLVHYGPTIADGDAVVSLIGVVTGLQRNAGEASGIEPGDRVLVDGATNARPGTVFVVRFADSGGNLLVQPDLVEDYVLELVSSTRVRPVNR